MLDADPRRRSSAGASTCRCALPGRCCSRTCGADGGRCSSSTARAPSSRASARRRATGGRRSTCSPRSSPSPGRRWPRCSPTSRARSRGRSSSRSSRPRCRRGWSSGWSSARSRSGSVSLVFVDPSSFAGAPPKPVPELLRLQAAGVAVVVLRDGDDLAERLGATRAGGRAWLGRCSSPRSARRCSPGAGCASRAVTTRGRRRSWSSCSRSPPRSSGRAGCARRGLRRSRCSSTGAIAFGLGRSGRCPAGCSRASATASSSSTTTRSRSTRRRTRGCTACCCSRCSPSRSPSRWRSPPAGPASPRWRSSSASAGRGRCCPVTTCCAGRCCSSPCSARWSCSGRGPVRGLGAALAAGTLSLAGGARRDELARVRQARVPRLAALGPVHQARQAGRRLLRLELELQRPDLPRQADDRHAREGRAAAALLARLRAEHGRERDLVRGGLARVRRPAGPARPAPGLVPAARAACERLGEGARDDRGAARPPAAGRQRPRPLRAGRAASAASRTTRAGVAIADHPLSRGDSYDVWSYAPTRRRRSSRRRSRSTAARSSRRDDEYREVQPRVYPRLFGTPGRAAYVHYLMTDFARADQLRAVRAAAGARRARGRRRAQPVRRRGRARAVVPLRRRLRLRPAPAEDAGRGRPRWRTSSRTRSAATASTSPERWR